MLFAAVHEPLLMAHHDRPGFFGPTVVNGVPAQAVDATQA